MLNCYCSLNLLEYDLAGPSVIVLLLLELVLPLEQPASSVLCWHDLVLLSHKATASVVTRRLRK